MNENVSISIKISLKFVPKGPINNIPALVQIMAWRRSGDKPLSEPIMVSLPMHICVIRPQWVKWQLPQRHCYDPWSPCWTHWYVGHHTGQSLTTHNWLEPLQRFLFCLKFLGWFLSENFFKGQSITLTCVIHQVFLEPTHIWVTATEYKSDRHYVPLRFLFYFKCWVRFLLSFKCWLSKLCFLSFRLKCFNTSHMHIHSLYM